MAGAGQLIAGSVDLMYLVVLGVVQPPDRAGTRASCDLDAREGGLLLARGGTVAQLQVIATSMAGAGQLVAGSVDLMYLVVLGVSHPPDSVSHPPDSVSHPPDGVSHPPDGVSHPPDSVSHPPDRAGTRASCDLDAREGGLLLARGNGRAAAGDRRLNGGGWPAGRRQCGSGVPGCPGRGTAARQCRWPRYQDKP